MQYPPVRDNVSRIPAPLLPQSSSTAAGPSERSVSGPGTPIPDSLCASTTTPHARRPECDAGPIGPARRRRFTTGRVRGADPTATPGTARSSPGHSGHDPALAPPTGRQKVDLLQPVRSPTYRWHDRRADRSNGHGEPDLGLQEIQGELVKLGTVSEDRPSRRILKLRRIAPAPSRHTDTTWRKFLWTQATTMLAVDFFHVDCAVTLKRIYVFFALEVGSRHVHIVGRRANELQPGPRSRLGTC
jgi:hypothetical protein